MITAVGFLIAAAFQFDITGAAKPNEAFQHNRKTYDLRGKVRSIIEFNYKQYLPDSAFSYHVTKRYYKFDKAGNCTELTTFLQQESFQNRVVYKYDEAGNTTELIAYNEDSTLDFRVTYTFDDEGNMIEFLNYSRYGDLKYREQRTYGPGRSFVKSTIGLAPPGTTSLQKYTYDAMGRRISQEDYYRDDKEPRRRTVWRYSGDTTRETEYDRWGSINRTDMTVYDKNKREIASYVNAGFEDMKEYNFRYDVYGNPIESIVKDRVGLDVRHSYRCAYKYDKKGNWIKRVTYKIDGGLKSSIERKIEYY